MPGRRSGKNSRTKSSSSSKLALTDGIFPVLEGSEVDWVRETAPAESAPEPKTGFRAEFFLSPWRLPGLVAGLVFAMDQATKAWVLTEMEIGEIRHVFPSFFHLVHFRNSGAAWGMFQGRTTVLAFLSIAILAGIVWRFSDLTEGRRERALALGLVIGGTIGNLYDRLFRGEVVDFLLFFFRSFKWPAFNVADSAICCGVGLFIASSFFRPGSPQAVGDVGKAPEPE